MVLITDFLQIYFNFSLIEVNSEWAIGNWQFANGVKDRRGNNHKLQIKMANNK
jgi:hypothetical protein